MVSYVLWCSMLQVRVCAGAIVTTFWLLSYKFGYRYARKSIKGSKDSDDSLVSKKNKNQKMAH